MVRQLLDILRTPTSITPAHMKDKSDAPRTRKTPAKAEVPAKKTAAKAAKTAKTTKVIKAEAVEKPARAPKAKTPAKKAAKSYPAQSYAAIDTELVAVAAYLNWCQRRNQGLPDDPIADWVEAEMAMGLPN